MSHPYTTYDAYPKTIAEALKRAKAWWRYDRNADILYIRSRNKAEPLTNNEKFKICQFLVMKRHAYREVKFED